MAPRIVAVVVGSLAACAVGLAALAAEPHATCEAKKLKFSGAYATCLLKEEAKARLKGVDPDAAKCAAQLATKMTKAEAQAGPGVCPTENDAGVVGGVVEGCMDEVSALLAGAVACPPGYETRSPDQVVTETLAAIEARDAGALACNYAEDAHVIDDQGVLVGQAEIIASLFSLADLLGNGTTTVTEQLPFRDTVRILFQVDAGWFVIEDGTATYLVRGGRIHRQTWHGLIEFTGPPPF